MERTLDSATWEVAGAAALARRAHSGVPASRERSLPARRTTFCWTLSDPSSSLLHHRASRRPVDPLSPPCLACSFTPCPLRSPSSRQVCSPLRVSQPSVCPWLSSFTCFFETSSSAAGHPAWVSGVPVRAWPPSTYVPFPHKTPSFWHSAPDSRSHIRFLFLPGPYSFCPSRPSSSAVSSPRCPWCVCSPSNSPLNQIFTHSPSPRRDVLLLIAISAFVHFSRSGAIGKTRRPRRTSRSRVPILGSYSYAYYFDDVARTGLHRLPSIIQMQ